MSGPVRAQTHDKAGKRALAWARLCAATATLGAAWAEFTLALKAYRDDR